SRGLPVFSFVDPDNLISDYGLGSKVTSIEEMADVIRKKINEKETFLKQAQKIKLFFEENFYVKKKIEAFESILLFNEIKPS
ncbi:unnamed protein product, partial [marine sediment metagenome]